MRVKCSCRSEAARRESPKPQIKEHYSAIDSPESKSRVTSSREDAAQGYAADVGGCWVLLSEGG